jgi:hypothetical protein
MGWEEGCERRAKTRTHAWTLETAGGVFQISVCGVVDDAVIPRERRRLCSRGQHRLCSGQFEVHGNGDGV